jgi:hypothetical protein
MQNKFLWFILLILIVGCTIPQEQAEEKDSGVVVAKEPLENNEIDEIIEPDVAKVEKTSSNTEIHVEEEIVINKAQNKIFNPNYENNEKSKVPLNLSLPFNINDVHQTKGVVNPLGVVRFSQDQLNLGHPGIDIPLKQGSEIYAVADGDIVLIDIAGDPWGGMKVFQLLQQTGTGSGWAFIYEHIKLAKGVTVGTKLKKGTLVGEKIAPDGFTVHLQFSKVFNDFKYTSDATCWPNFLNKAEKDQLNFWWEGYSKNRLLINSWTTNSEEGKYPFKGLLDKSKFPNGPQLCYPLGTDVR